MFSARKSLSVFSLITLSMALGACSQTKGVDAGGNCKSETVSAYNDINHKARMYNITLDRDYLIGTQNACNEFKNLIGGSSCKAEDLKTGSTTTISASTVDAVCNEVNDKLNPKPVKATAGEADGESRDEAAANLTAETN